MLFVLITSAKVVHKTKTHYTINNIFSIILIKELIVTHPTFQVMRKSCSTDSPLHRVKTFNAVVV